MFYKRICCSCSHDTKKRMSELMVKDTTLTINLFKPHIQFQHRCTIRINHERPIKRQIACTNYVEK